MDASIIGDHSILDANDEVYFWLEYTSGKNYTFGRGNDIISNLKKKPSTTSAAALRWKNGAIGQSSSALRAAIRAEWLAGATLVPMPGSKIAGHPDFDDRMVRVINGISPIAAQNMRELLRFRASLTAAHECGPGERPTVQDLIANLEINEALANPQPTAIGIVDDVLTAGVHFRAAKTVLANRFPGVPIVGFFIARRVFANDLDPVDTI